MPDFSHAGMYSSDHSRSGNSGGFAQDMAQDKSGEKSVALTMRESVELFQNAVDAAREEYHKTLNGQAPGEVLKPKLTVDLRLVKLSQIPKEVVTIIRQDVERLHLAKNGLSDIPYEFSQCSPLKYLNLRDNKFREIPKAIFGLPQLEILDLSRNRLSEVPDEIEHMKALRVFSIQNNSIQDLPYCLGSISTLRMLKVIGNPLNPTLQRVLDGDGELSSPSPALMKDDNERDTILTKKLTEHMRQHAAMRESGEDSTSDGPLETPRALSRFPVQPQYGHSTSGSESASDLRSPVFSRPSLPARSHTRIPSSQYGALQNAASRRPGLAPLALGNERNRSNSESVLQPLHNNKSKRMGLVTKKNSALGILDETRAKRNSLHLRGQSHGSALRNGVRAGDSSPSESPKGGEFRRGMTERHLTSVLEHKHASDNFVENTGGVLYSLNLIHPASLRLTNAIRDGKAKRSSIERDFLSATMHIEHLDQELLRMRTMPDQNKKARQQLNKAVAQATHDCGASHRRIMTFLVRMVKQFAKDADAKYIRTFMLTLYGSTYELSSAGRGLSANQSNPVQQKDTIQRVPTISEVSSEGDYTYKSDRSVTPTQRRKPERRLRTGSVVQQSISYANVPVSGVQTAVPLYSNGRSRSNSRARPFYGSSSSSVVSTPRSGESFSSANLFARSRSGSVNVTPELLQAEKKETAQFEKIFAVLSKSVEEGLRIIPHLHASFSQALAAAKRQYADPRLRDQWAALAARTSDCLEMTESLRTNLSTVRLNDREARTIRNFWQLAKTFLDSYGDLLLAIKEAIKHNLVDPNMRHKLRPVHTSTREAARLIATSPWNRLTFDADPRATPTPHAASQLHAQHPMPNGQHQQHHTRGSGGSTASGSPYPTNVPATPLSAALGPAAQATVPAALASTTQVPNNSIPPTPGTASLERSFEGDIFQRADTYQSLQQTMIPRRQII